MYRLEDLTLGKRDEVIPITTSAENGEIALGMVSQCRWRLEITSRHLDPAVYDHAPFIDAVKALALRSPHARIRVLVLDPDPVIHRGHRLLELANRLTSFIEIRRPGPEQQDFNEAMLIADETGIVHRRLSDRYEGTANFNDRGGAAELARRFDELWQYAVADPSFRRLLL